MIARLLSPRLVEALGFALLHALWQGALFAIALAILLVALRRYSPQARYLVCVGMLAAFALASAITFGRLYAAADAATPETLATADHRGPPGAADASEPPSASADGEVPGASALAPSVERLVGYYDRHLPLLVTAWLLGVLAMQLRWLGQLAYVQRLRHYGTEALPEAWRARLRGLEAALRIRRPVAYALSPRIDTPMALGWLRPVVLFPSELFARLGDADVYAVFAHELAHVRRDDFAVNLLQRLLTNVFFFHPGVWWMSRRSSDEREHACDDLAVAALGDALPYAKTLINVGTLSQPSATPPALAVAMRGRARGAAAAGGLGARIRRLLSGASGGGSFREGVVTAGVLAGALAVAGFAGHGAGAAPGPGVGDGVYALLLRAIDKADDSTVVALLGRYDINPDHRGPDGLTLLMAAAAADNAHAAGALIARGARVAAAADYRAEEVQGGRAILGHDYDDATALLIAAERGGTSVARALLDAGADPDRRMGNRHWHREDGRREVAYDIDTWTPRRQAEESTDAMARLFRRYGTHDRDEGRREGRHDDRHDGRHDDH